MALTTLITSILYFAGLFWLARWGDSSSETAQKFSRHPAVYSLTLAMPPMAAGAICPFISVRCYCWFLVFRFCAKFSISVRSKT